MTTNSMTVNPNMGGEFGPTSDHDLYVNPNAGGHLGGPVTTGLLVNPNQGGALRAHPSFDAAATEASIHDEIAEWVSIAA